jgi:ABC-2 type transport system permease protein
VTGERRDAPPPAPPQPLVPPPAARPDQVVAASGPGGAIYDIGYRGYAGPRLGRAFAVRSLSALTLRGAFGIGRGARSKIVPFGLLVLLLIPALISLGLSAIAGSAAAQFDPVSYETYYSITQTVLFLFIAAQAPELVGPDQRDRVLPLYFSRPITRDDYAFAKLLALTAALLLFTLAPQALLFFGRILQATDLGAGIADNLPSLLPILGSALFISVLFAAIGLAISSLTPRRAYATVTIIGVFIASNAIAGILFGVLRSERDIQRWTALLSIDTILAGVTSWLFQTSGGDMANPIVRRADLPGWLYALVALGLSAAAIAVVFRRYRTVES